MGERIMTTIATIATIQKQALYPFTFYYVHMDTDIDRYEYFTDIDPESEEWYITVDKFIADSPLELLQILDNITPLNTDTVFEVDGLIPVLTKAGIL